MVESVKKITFLPKHKRRYREVTHGKTLGPQTAKNFAKVTRPQQSTSKFGTYQVAPVIQLQNHALDSYFHGNHTIQEIKLISYWKWIDGRE